MQKQARSASPQSPLRSGTASVPPVFCWTKMGSEAGQSLADIIRRKDLERQCGDGIFAWGIGNSVGPSIKYAKIAEQIAELDALFTPMKAAPKFIDTTPSSVVMWLGYHTDDGEVASLPRHMLVTSRGHYGAGTDKRSHYALICRSQHSLASQGEQGAFDHHAVRNLVTSNPVGASQVTSVVRYDENHSQEGSYPVLFRARLTGEAFVRLAVPILLTGQLEKLYRCVCASSSHEEWRDRIEALKDATGIKQHEGLQARLF